MKARGLVLVLGAAAVLLVAGAHVLLIAGRPEVAPYPYWREGTIMVPAFAALGVLILSRRPGNVIGWLFLAVGIFGGFQLFSGQYATAALAPYGPDLPGGAIAGWISAQMQRFAVVSILFLLLLFPTGRLPSARWRPLAWALSGVVAVWSLADALAPGPLPDFGAVRNPFGVDGLALVLRALEILGGWAGLLCVVAVVLSLVARFRRSRGEERQQLKWFAYAATLGFLTILLGDWVPGLGEWAWTIALLGLPAAAAVAILRYRLYNIDLIINLTLVYAALTVALLVVYVGSVVVLQYSFRALLGGESSLAVVASTLAIAALFGPLRRRIQSVIDRRFYRARYDARRTVGAFGERLRDATDLDGLRRDLVGVVRETVAPAHVSLWLRRTRT